MKRFIAFCGDTFHVSGGMEDYIGHFDDLGDAQQAIEARDVVSWAHILDHQAGQIHKLGPSHSYWVIDDLAHWGTK